MTQAKYKELIGITKSLLTVTGFVSGTEGTKKRTFVLCKCQCGGERKITYNDFNKASGNLSCGCYGTGSMLRDGRKSKPEYNAYHNMLKRCHLPTHPQFKYYGARGICVCERWRKDFNNFLADMGPKPDGLTLERINVNGNYEPSNCKWATWSEQSLNKTTSKKNRNA